MNDATDTFVEESSGILELSALATDYLRARSTPDAQAIEPAVAASLLAPVTPAPAAECGHRTALFALSGLCGLLLSATAMLSVMVLRAPDGNAAAVTRDDTATAAVLPAFAVTAASPDRTVYVAARERPLLAAPAAEPEEPAVEPVARKRPGRAAVVADATTRPAPQPATRASTTGTCDEVACLLGDGSACCDKSETPAPPPEAATPRLPDRPSRGNVKSTLTGARGRVATCADRHDVTGIANVSLTVTPDGRATGATTNAGDDAFADCVATAVRTLRFEPSVEGVKVTFPYVL